MFRKPLPAKGDFALAWQKITKVIDDLHCKNHVEACKKTWNPDLIRNLYPNANLVCCEQTFAWLGRQVSIFLQKFSFFHVNCMLSGKTKINMKKNENLQLSYLKLVSHI